VSSTLLTLVVLPALYRLFERQEHALNYTPHEEEQHAQRA